jgi:dynein heavy chain
MWNNIVALSLHKFNGENNAFFRNLVEVIRPNIDTWKKWAYEKTDPENYPIPEFQDRIINEPEISSFLKLCLIRAFREDRAITSSFQFIKDVLGDSKYIEPITDTMESIANASSKKEPVLFLLSAGVDPTSSIDDLAKKRKK